PVIHSHQYTYFFPLMVRRPPRLSLFPYTTLFRSEHKNFAVVDGAMNDMIRPSLYNAWMNIDRVVAREGEKRVYDIVGAVCETGEDRKSTRLNSSHVKISYAVFCLKKKKMEKESIL